MTSGKQKHTGISITNALREEFGYSGSVSQVRRYIQRRRGELGLGPSGEVTLDRVKEPTGLCEADWTRVKIFLSGVLTTVWLLVVRFRFCGAHFVRGARTPDTESLLEGLQGSFEWFGGVPRVVQMDNDKVAVSKILRGRSRRETTAFRAFRAHYGFQAQFTMRSSPDENGTVEATMGPVARWLTPIPAFARMEDLNVYLLRRCQGYLRHQIRDRQGLVGDNFAIERNVLIPLPMTRYDTARVVRAKVTRQCRFLYREVWYSVPLAYRGREVTVKGYAGEVVARCDGREIARHRRGFRKGELVLEPLHYLPILRRKPHELDHAQAFRNWSLPLIYETFRAELERRDGQAGLRRYVEVLGLLEQFDFREVTAAMRQAARLETFSAEAVLFHLRHREAARNGRLVDGVGRWGLPAIHLARPNLAQYESLAM